MGTEQGDHLVEVYKMYGDMGLEQGQQRVEKDLAALGLTTTGKAARHEGAAEARKAHAEQVTKPAEPGATGTAPDASPAEAEPEAKGDARHEPPAGRHTPTRHQGSGGRS